MSDGKIKVSIKPKPIIKVKKTLAAPAPTAGAGAWTAHLADHNSMPIISFDVGIINLAYCIMSYQEINQAIEVYNWGIINLADGDPKKTCSRKMKAGNSKCTRKAYYVTDKGHGVCKMHRERNEDLQRNVTVENVTEWELKTKLFQELDSDTKYLDVTSILIESQPLKAREKIKGIGHALFDYYVLRGAVDTGHKYAELRFIDAKNKLTVYTGPPLSCHLKTQYARNKWYSIKYCSWIVENQIGLGLLKYFENYGKKKDDLADCFLQGLWYLKYGQTGKKAPMTSSHQKLVYRENNRLQYKKIRARAPTKKSLAKGRLTLSNIKYLVSKGQSTGSDIDPVLESSIKFFFGDIDYFIRSKA